MREKASPGERDSLREHLPTRDTTWRFFRFCVLTVISFSINLGLTALLHEVFAIDERVSFAIALVVVFVVNFLMQRYYVYRAAGGSARRQLVLYLLSSLGFRGSEYLAFLLVHSVLGVHYLISVVGVLGVSFMAKFFFYGTVVFRGESKQASSSGCDPKNRDEPGQPQ
ncbi:GtrA family protein [Candidatus Eisenbacteria bacterium]|uniref:GtrA family protein n=1 Tax=Eiseniibacteriota bacterium TaxID=2212470 RepID=A0ABV6YJG8_UNCEI